MRPRRLRSPAPRGFLDRAFSTSASRLTHGPRVSRGLAQARSRAGVLADGAVVDRILRVHAAPLASGTADTARQRRLRADARGGDDRVRQVMAVREPPAAELTARKP
jgi:hypothetical protein